MTKNIVFNCIFLFIVLGVVSCSKSKGTTTNIPKIDSAKKLNDYNLWKIENGKFYYDNKWVFLKIAKPLLNFADPNAVQSFIRDLGVLKSKNFNTIAINCYWHHFDKNGDGVPDVSLLPLKELIDKIYERGMNPCLSVETYSVGGGQMPAEFWSKFPDADAIDHQGKRVVDSEYGFGSRVVSIFHNGYREAARNFIRNLTKGVDSKKILYFETTVEPQFMGSINLCYSNAATQAYRAWLQKNNITGQNAQMPEIFPIPEQFTKSALWNDFRAEFLAEWVNGDAKAFRDVAGPRAYIAVDYLDATEESMMNRNGNPQLFLDKLTEPNIIQVNWAWYFPENKPNKKAYDRVRLAMKNHNRNWAITEHMTFNGTDFNHFTDAELNTILSSNLSLGTQFGWEFVSVRNATSDSFSMYNDDWSAKRVMGIVDDNWKNWLDRIYKMK